MKLILVSIVLAIVAGCGSNSALNVCPDDAPVGRCYPSVNPNGDECGCEAMPCCVDVPDECNPFPPNECAILPALECVRGTCATAGQ